MAGRLNYWTRKKLGRRTVLQGAPVRYRYFGDPAVENMQVPILAFNSSIGYVKYWWFA